MRVSPWSFVPQKSKGDSDKIHLAQIAFKEEVARIARSAFQFEEKTMEAIRDRIAAKHGVPKDYLKIGEPT